MYQVLRPYIHLHDRIEMLNQRYDTDMQWSVGSFVWSMLQVHKKFLSLQNVDYGSLKVYGNLKVGRESNTLRENKKKLHIQTHTHMYLFINKANS